MPGYECERFVSLTANEKCELTCSICQDIFCDPVVAQCCLQSFCEDCINDWLKNNCTCPYDRKTLTKDKLVKAPRVLVNMLGKLKIRCDFKDQGCKEVVLLENLNHHTLKCKYNAENKKKKCKKCFIEYPDKSKHDCVEALLDLNRKANQEIETLRRGSNPKPMISFNQTSAQLAISSREESLQRELRDLKAEKENFLKTIQELSKNGDNQKTSKGVFSSKSSQHTKTDHRNSLLTCSSEISELEIFNEARKHLWSPETLQNEMNKEVTSKVMAIVRNEIKELNSVFLVCKNIVEKLNAEFGCRWHCLAGHQKPVNSYFTYETGCLIKIRFGELFLEIYKTQFLNVQQLKQRFRNGKIKRDIKIIRTDMKQSMISDVRKITFAAIDRSDSLTDVCNELKTQMEKRYSGKWQCFVFAYFGVFGIQHTCGSFISFDLDCLTLTLFQAIQ